MIYTLSSGTTIYRGKAWTHPDGRQFPANWFNYTKEERDALGITETAEPESFDSEFYSAPGVARDLATLKANYVSVDKDLCQRKLMLSDWYIVRKTEKDIAIPAEVTTQRDAVRAAQVARESEINACADVDALKAKLYAPDRIYNSKTEEWEVNPARMTQYPENL